VKRSEENIRVYRSSLEELVVAKNIIDEYYAAVGVLVRDDLDQLVKYFNDDSGVWLASDGSLTVGCVALRPLATLSEACEIKRLYVRPLHRGMGIADRLMDALEAYALVQNYRFAFLDTKDDLQAAVSFYVRRGYTACERYNSNPQATIFMQRRLR
jgi:ribosomal protein S18 acetylase RimI-like enzyme